jgi:hypothetical protein
LVEDLSDLTGSIALGGDITLSRDFKQQQAFDSYPYYGRYAIQSLLQGIEKTKATTDDYYMDPNYNSDPTRFEVKEVSNIGVRECIVYHTGVRVVITTQEIPKHLNNV